MCLQTVGKAYDSLSDADIMSCMRAIHPLSVLQSSVNASAQRTKLSPYQPIAWNISYHNLYIIQRIIYLALGGVEAVSANCLWIDVAGPNMVVSHYAWNAEVPSMGWKWNKHAFNK